MKRFARDILPIIVLVLLLFFYLGWNFPGYCDRGDGVRCTGSGLSGFARVFFGGSMAAPALLIGSIFYFVVFKIWSAIVEKIFRVPLYGPWILAIIYCCLYIFAFTAAYNSAWEPVFTDTTLSGFLAAQ